MKGKRILAFDFDGVVVDKPIFISKKLIEMLFKGHCKNDLEFRYPSGKINQIMRKVSHIYFLRPAIKRNLEFLKKISRNKNLEIFLVSGRYHFLKKETDIWISKNGLKNVFIRTYINMGNEQPHLFKEKILKKIRAEVYVDDDPLISDYLQSKLEIKVFCYSREKVDCKKATWVEDLEGVLG